jgi:plasmid stabilization system protein ParE
VKAPIEYRQITRRDVDEYYSRYERLEFGLGDRFLAALRDRIEQIRDNPFLYSKLVRDIRAVKLHKFPQVVYYRVLNGCVIVVGVLHSRRDPRRLRKRK